MKKIINGKMYNTDTAAFIGSYSNGYDYHIYGWLKEVIYKKKTGEYFMSVECESLTPYAKECLDGWAPGVSIIPLSVDEAMKWAEKKLSADEYIEIFGTPEE